MPGLEEASDRYLDHLRVERNLSPRTLEAYARDLTSLRTSLAGQGVHDALDVTPARLARWLRSLSEDGQAASSQGRALSAARQFFVFLVREGELKANPVDGLQGPKRRRPLPVVITRQEATRLVEAPAGESPRALRARAALELLYAAGLRASELCLLRMDDLNLELGVVRPMGKGSKERVVPVGAPALEALRAYLDRGRPALLKGRPSAFVFVGLRGKALTRMGLFKIVRRNGRAAGVARRLSPHKLRHAFATHLLHGGADLRSVQEMLGHANIATTEIYTHVERDQLLQTVDDFHPLGRKRPG